MKPAKPTPAPKPDPATITPYENRIGNAMGSMRPREGRGRMAAFALALGLLAVGCGHAQVTPTSYQVDLAWVAPVASGSWLGCGTGQPACSYVMSRLTVAAGATACPAVNLSTPNYAPLNTATPAAGLTFVDTGAVGTTACYIVQTLQGTAVSNPSNVAGPLVVPASPLAPTLSAPTAVADAKPLAVPTGKDAPVLTATVRPIYR